MNEAQRERLGWHVISGEDLLVSETLERLTNEKAELEARLRAAEEALRDIRWMHQEDNVSYRHLFLKAQARAAVFLDMGDNTPPEETA